MCVKQKKRENQFSRWRFFSLARAEPSMIAHKRQTLERNRPSLDRELCVMLLAFCAIEEVSNSDPEKKSRAEEIYFMGKKHKRHDDYDHCYGSSFFLSLSQHFFLILPFTPGQLGVEDVKRYESNREWVCLSSVFIIFHNFSTFDNSNIFITLLCFC